MSESYDNSLCVDKSRNFELRVITHDQEEKVMSFEKCNICKRDTPYDYSCSQCRKIFCSNCLRTYRGLHWTDEIYICNICDIPAGYWTIRL